MEVHLSNPIKKLSCPNSKCISQNKKQSNNIIRYGSFKTKRGTRRRYRCKACGHTFCNTRSTPYYRLQHSRNAFDQAASMSVEGVSKSSISRIMGISWNTAARWEEKAAASARSFNINMTKGYELTEVQVDEIRTFSGSKNRTLWVFASMAVWSRLWTGSVVGRRSYRNTRKLMRQTIKAGQFTSPPLFATDGFEFYAKVIRELLPNACIHGQVMKQWRQNRVGRITRSLITGTDSQLNHALLNSEDSQTINTSFIERLNLTIRRGSSYLQRKTPCHSRRNERLDDHLELLRCHYNFIRPHGSLKFGPVTRTPAMQAGLVTKPYTFRKIFMTALSWVTFWSEKIDDDMNRALESGLRMAA